MRIQGSCYLATSRRSLLKPSGRGSFEFVESAFTFDAKGAGGVVQVAHTVAGKDYGC